MDLSITSHSGRNIHAMKDRRKGHVPEFSFFRNVRTIVAHEEEQAKLSMGVDGSGVDV
jgi:hypothetical protein